MALPFLKKTNKETRFITLIKTSEFENWLKKQPKDTQNLLKFTAFKNAAGQYSLLPNGDVLFIRPDQFSLYTLSELPAKLPKNDGGYSLDQNKLSEDEANLLALGWALGSYQFDRYKSQKSAGFAKLVMPLKADAAYTHAATEATFLVRDLVNIPANDLGPAELEDAAKALIKNFNKTSFKVTRDQDLITQNYPAIYAVGKASPRAPRLIDFTWGNPKHPKVTIIGKGVCFDTGGLDIKPSSAMELMKKDMGGAAHALGLAHMIMSLNLPVRLRVLIPAVENSIAGNAFRPGDVIPTRKGISVEIGNTDAEGRVILADALHEATSEKPALIIDFATLTGAARVALGAELPALFSNQEKLAQDFVKVSHRINDPVWQLPLWQPYHALISSKIADINNAGSSGMAGSITAALFLEKFVTPQTAWLHLDTYAWNNGNVPGKPYGGEALGMRAAYALIHQKFGHKGKTAKPKTKK